MIKINKTPLFAESWNVAFRRKPEGSLLSNQTDVFYIIPNSWRYWAADPFLFQFEGNTYIFAELYDYTLCRGVIGYCEITGNRTTPWKVVIREPYHLSFPNIFSLNGEIYIMPESCESGELYLYRCLHFPDRWCKEKVLRSDVHLTDTVLLTDKKAISYDVSNPYAPRFRYLDLEHTEKDREVPLPDVELRRMAGKVFSYDLIRPAQNCAEDYGKSLIFYRYDFSEDYYSECELCRICATDLSFDKKIYLDGMHTYNATAQYEVIDLKTRRFNIINLFFRFLSKICCVLKKLL